MERLSAVVERLTFVNEKNGFCVLRVRAQGHRDLVTVVGSLAGVSAGSGLELCGEWRVDAKYGRQFSATSFRETFPATLNGIEKYLGSGLIKGIGPAFARRIVRHFREDTLRVIEEEPQRLTEAPGIGEKRVAMISEAWHAHREIKNVMIFLQDNGVSTTHAVKIFKAYGDRSVAVVKENPYRLADDIWGIGFVTADRIARALGFGADSPERCRAGIAYVLGKFAEDGHCFAHRGELIERSAKLLEVGVDKCEAGLAELIDGRRLVVERGLAAAQGAPVADFGVSGAPGASSAPVAVFGATGVTGAPVATPDPTGPTGPTDPTGPTGPTGSTGPPAAPRSYGDLGPLGGQDPPEAIYLPLFYYSEAGVARQIADICRLSPKQQWAADAASGHVPAVEESVAEAIRWTEAETGVQYDGIQKDAVRAALTSPFMVLTGGPGTGKTTTTNAIIKAYERLGAKVALAAPTGRAAKRLSEATGREAKTIHRLLEMKPPDGYKRDKENPLPCDVLVVDEASMIDIALANSMLKAVRPGASVVLVGDVDQLPSVGPGSVLKDIIRSGGVRTVELRRIFRQAQASDIVKNAHRVNAGQMPLIKNSSAGTDFFFMQEEEPQDVAEAVVSLCKERLPRFYAADPLEDIQVLCPMARGEAGSANLNAALQAALNENRAHVRHGSVSFRLGDKVMQIRNNYDKNVFNGDIGRIVGVNGEEWGALIRYDGRDVAYDVTELDEIVLAYAVTVHKSQGSEYPIVVCPITTQHFMMLQKNLLYTAITRAKRAIVLVGTRKALAIAVRNKKSAERNTLLAERIARLMA